MAREVRVQRAHAASVNLIVSEVRGLAVDQVEQRAELTLMERDVTGMSRSRLRFADEEEGRQALVEIVERDDPRGLVARASTEQEKALQRAGLEQPRVEVAEQTHRGAPAHARLRFLAVAERFERADHSLGDRERFDGAGVRRACSVLDEGLDRAPDRRGKLAVPAPGELL